MPAGRSALQHNENDVWGYFTVDPMMVLNKERNHLINFHTRSSHAYDDELNELRIYFTLADDEPEVNFGGEFFKGIG